MLYFEQNFAKRLLKFILKTLFSQTVTYDTIAKVVSVNVSGEFPETRKRTRQTNSYL